MLKKIKKVFGKCKAFVVGAIATVSACAMAAVASAEEATSASGLDMEALLTDAGNSLQGSLTGLVKTMIPVIMGVLGAGLVIFGIFAMIKLIKKVFGKVAG